jgi:hypothetical protein
MSTNHEHFPTSPEELAEFYKQRAEEVDRASRDIDLRAWEAYWHSTEISVLGEFLAWLRENGVGLPEMCFASAWEGHEVAQSDLRRSIQPTLRIVSTDVDEHALSLQSDAALFWFVIVVSSEGDVSVPDVFRRPDGYTTASWAPEVLKKHPIRLGEISSGLVCCFVSTRDFLPHPVPTIEAVIAIVRDTVEDILRKRDYGFCFLEQPFGATEKIDE